MNPVLRNIIFLLLFFLVGASFSNCNNKKGDVHAEHKEKEVYTCPMHPEIIRDQPGSCPICGMDLVKKEPGGESLTEVDLDVLLRPSNSFVVSTVPVIALETREEDVELNVVGTVAYDTRQLGAISSRVGGRIEKLYLRYKYQRVQKGQKVMDLYSPELVTAQQNLLFLLKNDPGNQSMINAAKDRLMLLGMTSGQVNRIISSGKPDYSISVYSNYSGFVTDPGSLTNMNQGAGSSTMQSPASSMPVLSIKEGMYVNAGQAIFSVYNANNVWILLDIYPEQQGLVQVGNPVRIIPETALNQSTRATINYIEPVFRQGNKTLTARVYFNNSALQLPVGSRVTAVIFGKSKKAEWLPKEAVLSLGKENIVFKKEPGGFRAHAISTGMEINRYVQVLSGIAHSDSIAANAQFLVDNEAFIKIR